VPQGLTPPEIPKKKGSGAIIAVAVVVVVIGMIGMGAAFNFIAATLSQNKGEGSIAGELSQGKEKESSVRPNATSAPPPPAKKSKISAKDSAPSEVVPAAPEDSPDREVTRDEIERKRAGAIGIAFPKLTLGDTVFANATVTAIDEFGISVKHEGGLAKVKWGEVPKEVQDKWGFDPLALAQLEEQQRRQADAQSAAEEPDALQGSWILVDAMSDGKRGNNQAPSHQSWEIRGDRITLNGSRDLYIRFEKGASPKQLFIENRIAGKVYPIYACIYRMDGDHLIVCFDAGETPPTTFSANKDEFQFLLKLRRG
jgi:uncharacterized protein (TIGR03067 family)